MMERVPTHFQPEALKFLRGLTRHNDREWFEARRNVYEQALKSPMLALIEEINGAMIDFAPANVRTPAKTMLRIYRDTRFSSDKRPYKRHIAAWFGRRGAVRTTGPGFYLHVSPTEVEIAAGVFMPLPEHLLAIRQWMDANHASFQRTLNQVTKPPAKGIALEHTNPNALARIPKGFAAGHPAGELLRARRWGVHQTWPGDIALEPEFSSIVIATFKAAAPLVSALSDAVGSGPAAAAKKHLKSMF